MDTIKKLYSSLAARIVVAMILTSAGMILSDVYKQVSLPLAMLGMLLIVLGLAVIPGWGAGSGANSADR